MKYRKKPVEVDAFAITQEWLASFRDPKRFEPQADGEVVSFCSEYVDRESFPGAELWIREDSVCIFVQTLEGRMEGNVGDFLITGVKGEKYFCKPDIFAATYEEVK